MEPQIRFCKTPEGVNLAYSTIGQGPVLLVPPYWISHLEVEWENPLNRAFFERLATRHTLIQYDKHGCGLSDRDRTDFTLNKELRDLEAIIDHLQLNRFILLGISMGGPTSIAYAVRHPERLSHLILYGTYARGASSAPAENIAPLCALIRASWGLGSKTLADIFIPDADADTLKFFARLQRKASTAEVAARMIESSVAELDVTDILRKITTPAIVIHRKGDRACSVRGGRELAAGIQNARLVLLNGIDHIPALGDSESVLNAIFEFINGESDPISDSLVEKTPRDKKLKRKLAAILSADIKKYSRLMEQDEEATVQALNLCRGIITNIIHKYRGRLVDFVGDNFMVEFISVLNAVQCAVEIQKELKAKNLEFPKERQMEFRMGINLGDVVEEGDRIFGDGVNIASRIEGLAESGGVCISGTVYDQVENKLPMQFEFKGEQSVKNISKPVRVYCIKMEL